MTSSLPAGDNSITAVYSGDSDYAQSTSVALDQEVDELPPTVTSIAAANLDPSETTATVSVQAADGGDSNLTYSWAATGVPTGAPLPTFGENGDFASNDTTVMFGQAGTYQFTVTITISEGMTTASSVSVPVGTVETSLAPVYAGAVLGNNLSVPLSATAYDQFGFPIADPPAQTWSITSASPVGTIVVSAGSTEYDAPSTGSGTDVLTVADGTLSTSFKITVGKTETISDDSELAASGQPLLIDDGSLEIDSSAGSQTVRFPIPYRTTRPLLCRRRKRLPQSGRSMEAGTLS